MSVDKVSVVIPCFNDEAYIAEAVNSVLNQTYPVWEVICVDDGSTDQSLSIISSINSSKLKVLSQLNSGAAAARNRGVTASTGNLLCFLDADDIWSADKVERQIRIIDQAQISFGQVEEFFDSTVQIQGSPRVMPGYSPITMMIKKEDYDRVGDFNEGLSVAEFVDWLSRAKHLNLSITMDEGIYAYRRIHAGNIGRLNKPNASHYAVSLKAALDRKRSQSP
jgi:glycosyltransferase involved in cell wall biosynthesis